MDPKIVANMSSKQDKPVFLAESPTPKVRDESWPHFILFAIAMGFAAFVGFVAFTYFT